jgi:hypothetical protein
MFLPSRPRAPTGDLLESPYIMASFEGLADALYREEVARARAMSPAEKLLEGPRLFDRSCRLMADGVRHRHPDLDEGAVRAQVEAQLARLKAIETS